MAATPTKTSAAAAVVAAAEVAGRPHHDKLREIQLETGGRGRARTDSIGPVSGLCCSHLLRAEGIHFGDFVKELDDLIADYMRGFGVLPGSFLHFMGLEYGWTHAGDAGINYDEKVVVRL